jgi:hypothetical protein
MKFLNQKAVKDYCHEHGKRVGKEFLDLFNAFIEKKLKVACGTHNGSKKTLDASIAGFVGLTK